MINFSKYPPLVASALKTVYDAGYTVFSAIDGQVNFQHPHAPATLTVRIMPNETPTFRIQTEDRQYWRPVTLAEALELFEGMERLTLRRGFNA